MASPIPLLEGKDWEQFCVEALELRYGTSFQKVPSRFRGDYGIDGFVSGEKLFQFFGDEAGSSASARSEAQQRKLRTDIPKLAKNERQIAELIRGEVSEYVFLVSLYEDKAVQELANKLAAKVIDSNLSFIGADFRIVVKDRDFLLSEWQQLYGAVRQKLSLPSPSVPDEKVDELENSDSSLINMLTEKIEPLGLPGGTDKWRRLLIQYRLEEMVVLDQMRDKGEIWQRLREMKGEREDTLTKPRLTTSPADDLASLCDGFQRDLTEEIASLPYPHSFALAWGAAADWLMRCPLDYRDV